MIDDTQERIKRDVFDAEQELEIAAPITVDSRDSFTVRVTRTRSVGQDSVGVELVASRMGWERSVIALIARHRFVETRRWSTFGDAEFRYDIYVSEGYSGDIPK